MSRALLDYEDLQRHTSLCCRYA